MIIAVSDIHIGARRTNTKCFDCFINHFLAKEPVDDLILLGDIVDLWRENWETVLPKVITRFNGLAELSNIKRIHFVKGNHDYKLREYLEDASKIQKLKANNPNLELKFKDKFHFRRGPSVDSQSDPRESEKILILESGGTKFLFTHGYQFEADQSALFDIKGYEDKCESFCDEGGNLFLKLGGLLYDAKDEIFGQEPDEFIKTVQHYIKEADPHHEYNEEKIRAHALNMVALKQRQTEMRTTKASTKKELNKRGAIANITKSDQEYLRNEIYFHAPPEKRRQGQTPLSQSQHSRSFRIATILRRLIRKPRGAIYIPSSEEEAGQEKFYVKPGEHLIYGHVHQPGRHYQFANTGAWTEDQKDIPFSNFLIIHNGEVTLRHWPPQQNKKWNYGDRFKELQCLSQKCDEFR